MFAQIKSVNQYWMKLDPTEQFMAWTVIGVMLSGALLVAFALIAPSIGGQYVPYLIIGVGLGVIAIVSVFISAVIYLTVIWPHHYAKHQEHLSGKSAQGKGESMFASTSTKVYMRIEDPEEGLELIENAKSKAP